MSIRETEEKLSLIGKIVRKKDRLLEYDKNWLCHSLKDSKLHSHLEVFLDGIDNPRHWLWTGLAQNPCSFMVDHGLLHVLNVFRYATRLFYDVVHNPKNPHKNKDFLKEHVDKVCLIVSIWLHDWGMMGAAQPPHYSSKKLLRKLDKRYEEASEKLGFEYVKITESKTKKCPWIRSNHAWITHFNIVDMGVELGPLMGLDNLGEALRDYDRTLVDIAIISLFHGFPLHKLKEFGSEHLSGLCALLAFLDGCDENWQRLMSTKQINKTLCTASLYGSQYYENIHSTIHSRKLHSVGISEKDVKRTQDAWDKGKCMHAAKLLRSFLNTSKNQEGLMKLIKEIEYYKKNFVDQYKDHIEPKTLIEDVYFKNGEIIIVPRHRLLGSKNRGIKRTINRIRKHFRENRVGFEKLGLQFTENSIRLWKPEDGDPDELEIQELGPFPPIEEKINKMPERAFPREEDFENGLVYFDKKQSKEIESALNSKRYYLLYGLSSSRKTTFSLSFGLHLRQKGYSVFHRDVEEGEKWPEWRRLAERVKPYDEGNVLFIIDECHNSPNTIGKFVNKVKVDINNAKFLFVSRKISPSLFSDEIFTNYFNILKSESKETGKDPEQAFLGIIKQFCIVNGIEKYEERIGKIEKIIETCGHKFTILNVLLGVWKDHKFKKVLSEIPKENIYQKIMKDTIKTNPRAKILSRLSVIYQFGGTPISPEGINALGVNVESDAFKELKSEGLIYRGLSKTTSKIYFSLSDHPTYVRQILETLEHTGLMKLLFPQFMSIDEYSFAVLKDYFLKVKGHIAILLSSIHMSEEPELGERLIQNESIISALADYLRLIKNPTAIDDVLTSLRGLKIRKEDKEVILSKETLEHLARNISELLRSLPGFSFMLRGLRNFEREKAEEFLEMIEPGEVARICRKRMFESGKPKNVGLLASLVRDLGKISRVFSRKFLEEFTERELLELLYNSKTQIIEEGKCNQIYGFWQRCRFSSNVRNAYRIFFDRHSVADLFNFLCSLNLVHDGMLIRVAYWHPKFQNAYELFLKLLLPERLKKESLEDFVRYVSRISEIRYKHKPWIGRDLAIKNVELLKGLDVLNQKLEESSIETIQKLINIGKELNIDDFVRHIENVLEDSEFNLREKLAESDLKNLGFFIWNVSDNISLSARCNSIMQDLTNELVEKTKNMLEEKDTKESRLHAITIFLWSLFITDSKLLKMIPEDMFLKGMSRKHEKIGEVLSFMGVFAVMNPEAVKRLGHSKIQTIIHDRQAELKGWLNTRKTAWLKKRQLGNPRTGFPDLVKFILATKGYRRISEKECISLLSNFDTEEIMEGLKDILYYSELENALARSQIIEFHDWLSSART